MVGGSSHIRTLAPSWYAYNIIIYLSIFRQQREYNVQMSRSIVRIRTETACSEIYRNEKAKLLFLTGRGDKRILKTRARRRVRCRHVTAAYYVIRDKRRKITSSQIISYNILQVHTIKV